MMNSGTTIELHASVQALKVAAEERRVPAECICPEAYLQNSVVFGDCKHGTEVRPAVATAVLEAITVACKGFPGRRQRPFHSPRDCRVAVYADSNKHDYEWEAACEGGCNGTGRVLDETLLARDGLPLLGPLMKAVEPFVTALTDVGYGFSGYKSDDAYGKRNPLALIAAVTALVKEEA